MNRDTANLAGSSHQTAKTGRARVSVLQKQAASAFLGPWQDCASGGRPEIGGCHLFSFHALCRGKFAHDPLHLGVHDQLPSQVHTEFGKTDAVIDNTVGIAHHVPQRRPIRARRWRIEILGRIGNLSISGKPAFKQGRKIKRLVLSVAVLKEPKRLDIIEVDVPSHPQEEERCAFCCGPPTSDHIAGPNAAWRSKDTPHIPHAL